MAKAKKLTEEDKQALLDRDWWSAAAEVVDCKLHGFTYRHSASFWTPDGRTTVEVPGWLAEKLIALAINKHA